MKNYEKLTGFISAEELEEASAQIPNGAGTPTITIATAITKATISIATYAVCDTGACTSYCD
ncbi:hypothetical protein [Clostridium oceanicum]|uniref:Uncharacterized protein n=1 Tax=Clostridium oceanicum TaxID=1543 RepID=A0ABP3VAH7_9CLOT